MCAEKPDIVQKAMIVCSDRQIAYDLLQEILSVREDWGVPRKAEHEESLPKEKLDKLLPLPKINLVATQGKDDDKALFDACGNKEYRKKLDKQFKNTDSNFTIAIVVDMWITGFDVPSMDTMYLDKPVETHNLIQTISRVNRVFKGKKEAAASIKKLRNVEGQNLLTRMMRSIVTPLSKDLNMMKGVTFWQKLGYKAQNCVSVPLKFLLVMMVIDTKFRDVIKKCCNTIFGKDYDSLETEEHDKEKEIQKEFTKKDLTERLYKAQAAKMAEQNKPIINKTINMQENNQQENIIAPLPVKLKSEDELMQKMSESQIMPNKIVKQDTQQQTHQNERN